MRSWTFSETSRFQEFFYDRMKSALIHFTGSLHQHPTNLVVFIRFYSQTLQTSYNMKLEMEMISGTPLHHEGQGWILLICWENRSVLTSCNWWTFGAGLRSETARLICSCVCAVESFTAQRSFSLSLRSEASAAISASVLHLEGTSSSSWSCFCNCRNLKKRKILTMSC